MCEKVRGNGDDAREPQRPRSKKETELNQTEWRKRETERVKN